MRRHTLALCAAAGACIAISAVHADRGVEPQAEVQAVERVRYDGHRTVRVTVNTPRELMTVLALTDDVLTCEGAGIGTFDVRFSPEQYAAFAGSGITHDVLIEDLQAYLDQWWAANEEIRQQDSGWYEALRDLQEVETRIDQLVAAHPDLATVSVIGQSLAGSPIRMVRITGPGSTQDRPAIVINGTQHSRESLSPMVTMYFLEHLLTEYATDPRVQEIVDGVDFHIVPMINPDGYEHVWNTDPMWRKNRRENAGSSCLGVDLNRNWGHKWGQQGSSGDPCSNIFRGDSAFSEPETQAIGSVIDALGQQGRLKAHLDIHSAAQRFLSPYGYTTELPPDLPMMNYLGQLMQDAIYAHRQRYYPYGPGSLILYVVSGGARDYSYGEYGAMSWTLELSGPGFYPPQAEILPVSIENTSAMLALAEFFLDRGIEGACCLGSGCQIMAPAACFGTGGVYMGDDTLCKDGCTYVLTTGPANVALTSSQRGGIFLDLTAASELLHILQFETYFNNSIGSAVEFEIWTYPGSYVGRDDDPTGWRLHEEFNLISNGSSVPTPMPLTRPIEVAAGETVGVYILASDGNLRYTRDGAQPTWQNDHLALFSDRSRSQPWGGSLFTVRTFAGSIHYVTATPCYADCDMNGELNVNDFMCFVDEFAAAQALPPAQQVEHYANCDGSTTQPVLTVNDFLCFLDEFAAGCE